MERFQSGVFRKIVFVHMTQALVFSVTGIVDSAFAGQFIGAEGLAGMKLAMPVFSVQYMIAGILSTGLSVQVTKHLAKGKRYEANQCFVWVCSAAAATSVIFMLTAAVFPGKLTDFFADHTPDMVLYENVGAYLLPIMFGTLPVMMQVILSGIAALEGADRRLTASIVAVFISDIAGDLIAVKTGAGIRGIAVASVAAYLCACLVLSDVFVPGRSFFRLERLSSGSGMLTAVMLSGAPVAVKFLCEFIYPMAVNRMMLRYGSVSDLAALSIQDASRYLPLALCEGISAAVLLLTGMFAAEYDSGSLKRERKDILRFCVQAGTAWALVLMAAAPLVVKLFTKDAALQETGAFAFRWYLLGLPFMSFNTAVCSYMQGMGRQRDASIVTLINQLALPVMITWAMGSQSGARGIFEAFAVHQIILTCVLACMHFVRGKGRQGYYGEERWKKIDAELRSDLTTMEQVTQASDDVISICEKHGVDRKQAFNVGLCLEELASNSLLHGYKDGREKYLEFRFIITGRWMILRLRDNGRPFDLTERYKLLNPDDPVSGLGLRLVFAAAEDVGYSHVFDMNNVCIRVLKQNSNQRLTD